MVWVALTVKSIMERVFGNNLICVGWPVILSSDVGVVFRCISSISGEDKRRSVCFVGVVGVIMEDVGSVCGTDSREAWRNGSSELAASALLAIVASTPARDTPFFSSPQRLP